MLGTVSVRISPCDPKQSFVGRSVGLRRDIFAMTRIGTRASATDAVSTMGVRRRINRLYT